MFFIFKLHDYCHQVFPWSSFSISLLAFRTCQILRNFNFLGRLEDDCICCQMLVKFHWPMLRLSKSQMTQIEKMTVRTARISQIKMVLINFSFAVEPDVLSQRTYRSSLSVNETISGSNRDFKILVETKSNARHCIHLVAPTVQDKEAWISDISQCIDNIHMHTLLSPSMDRASIGPQLSLHSDPRLFNDDVDIRFSRTLNSCKLPQVRYATPERLLQRLTGTLISLQGIFEVFTIIILF